jgi:hypothetical protein
MEIRHIALPARAHKRLLKAHLADPKHAHLNYCTYSMLLSVLDLSDQSRKSLSISVFQTAEQRHVI